jgi:pimeloyl-ACP methyl ester carboxylesterase
LGVDVAHYDAFAFPSDPAVLGIEFETVTYRGQQGDLEAWFVPGDGSTWIVAVHGLGADRTEFLRFLTATDDLNYPTLIVRYRNDEGSPTANDLRILAGQEEWEDVAAAVDYALVNDAADVVIYGASMGGALTLGYTYNANQGTIRALILESPVADMRQVVQLRSGEALPIGGLIGDSMLAVGRGVVWLRTGLDFDTVDYVDRADELRVPVLLFHGEADTTIPFEVGKSLAEARPDLVEFHPLEDAAHVRAWNEDPEQYETTLEAFLQRVGRSD